MPDPCNTLAFHAGHPTLIGMLHLGALGGEGLVEQALADLAVLEASGFDAALLENWEDRSPGPQVSEADAHALREVAERVAAAATIPLGINVLPNDHAAAFRIAAACGLAFVQLDVLVDAVRTDYTYSDAPPFEVRVDLAEVEASRRAAPGVQLLATIQPKHYALLEAGKPLARSAEEAVAAGADAIVVTGAATGSAPDRERLELARAGCGGVPLLVGSGLTPGNAGELLAGADGAIVGTSVKTPDFGRVDEELARALVAVCRNR